MKYAIILSLVFCVLNLQSQDFVQKYQLFSHSAEVSFLSFSKNGKWLLSGDKKGGVFLWDMDAGAKVQEYEGHHGMISHLEFHPYLAQFVSAGHDGLIMIWNMDSSSPLYEFDSPNIGAYGNVRGNEPTFSLYTQDGLSVLFGGYNAGLYRLDLQEGSITQIYKDKLGGLTCAKLLGNQELIFAAGPFVHYFDIQTNQISKSVQVGTNTDDYICELDFDQVNQELFIWTYGGNAIHWKNEEEKISNKASNEKGSSNVCVLEGKQYYLTGNKGKKAYIHDYNNRPIQELIGHQQSVKTMDYNAPTNLLATGSLDKSIIIWNQANDITDHQVEEEVIEEETLVNNNGRPIKVLETVNLENDLIEIVVWDHEVVDGDTISLILNGKVLLHRKGVSGQKIKINTELTKQKNLLTLFAHNLGRIPPNTITIIINPGPNQIRRVLNSDMNTSESLILKRR